MVSAVQVYNDLTAMLVDWRRLELATWPRLFDFEVEECKNDARSWWFLIYENVIETPERLLKEGHDLKQHAFSVVTVVLEFLSSSTIGQFSQRIGLLGNFISDLADRILFNRKLTVIYNALANVVSYFTPYIKAIEDHLGAERKRLDGSVREVVQLASWRDTNIESLKQSAKNSHRKLFKHVLQWL